MGKSLEGKELGKGISQRQDGYYIARYTDLTGKRIQKLFGDFETCKEWLESELEYIKTCNVNVSSQLTVNEWYEYWIGVKERTTRVGTVENYKVRYRMNIKGHIGEKRIKDITSVDCQKIMNNMADKGYSSSTILLAKITLHNLLEYAYLNEIIPKNPCNKLVKSNIGKKPQEKTALTIEEQRVFCEMIKGTKYELQYRFVLQTGLRVSELIGLRWQDVDFEKRTLQIDRILTYKYNEHEWLLGEPKSKSGHRKIPLTDEAIRILKAQKEKNTKIKVRNIAWKDYIFLSNKGEPVKDTTYNDSIYLMCYKRKVNRLSMHILRHTFATRCIEAGMMPKTLQTILGHANLAMTMDRYVHTTDEQRVLEMDRISALLIV